MENVKNRKAVVTTKKYVCAIHTEKRGKANVHSLVYGINPFGIRGGTCGNIVDGHILSVTTSWSMSPEWMTKAGKEIEKAQYDPENVRVYHKSHTSTFEIELIAQRKTA
jgi:hypothetical protein